MTEPYLIDGDEQGRCSCCDGIFPQRELIHEEGDRLECRPCWERCDKEERAQESLRRLAEKIKSDPEDPEGCPGCGALAGCCTAYPNCPGGKQS